jgi:hypothetical protein
MKIPSDITRVSFRSYHDFGKILDFMWASSSKGAASASLATQFAQTLIAWRGTINKMRIYSSPDMPLIERLNLNRAVKDIDSLLFRLSKITGKPVIKVNDVIESESISDTES